MPVDRGHHAAVACADLALDVPHSSRGVLAAESSTAGVWIPETRSCVAVLLGTSSFLLRKYSRAPWVKMRDGGQGDHPHRIRLLTFFGSRDICSGEEDSSTTGPTNTQQNASFLGTKNPNTRGGLKMQGVGHRMNGSV